jgi:hypothetical protein
MWKSRLLSLALVVGPVLACDGTPTTLQNPIAPPSAALLQNVWFPIQSDYLACNGDVLSLVGQVHFSTVQRYNDAGKYESRIGLNLKGTATGPDGSVYNVLTNSMHLMNDPPTAGMEVTWLDRVRLIGQGPAANESFRYLIRGTMNASGEITTVRDKCTLSCLNLGAESVACL